jgi:hypothetical protein
MINYSSNADEYIKRLKQLDIKKQRKVIIDTLKKSAQVITDDYKKRLKATPEFSTRKYGSFFKAIRIRPDRKYLEVVARINNNKGKGFMLPWYELGTANRFVINKKKGGKTLKKSRYTGRIKTYGFFEKSVEDKQKEAQRIIEDNMIKIIDKIWNKR